MRFASIETWHQWARAAGLAHLVVMQRPGCDSFRRPLPAWACHGSQPRRPRVDRRRPGGASIFRPLRPRISPPRASRAAIARGESVQGQLPSAVWDYIRENRTLRPLAGEIDAEKEALSPDSQDALLDAKGQDIMVLDVRKVTDFTDYMVIVSGTSRRHVQSSADKCVHREAARPRSCAPRSRRAGRRRLGAG